MLAAWIAFLDLQRRLHVPYPSLYTQAFQRAQKIPRKEHQVLSLIVEGKNLLSTLLEEVSENQETRIVLERVLDVGQILSYIRRVSELEQELSLRKESSLRDSLTRLWNRRGLEKFFKEVVKPNIYKEDYLFCFIDLDDFKAINDTYGHQYGDKALKRFASFLQQNFKPRDFICRLYGDEFGIVVVGSTLDVFVRFARTLHKRGMEFKLPDGKHSKKISYSIGITNIIGQDSLEDVISRADAAMYDCKRDGKIGVVRV